MRYTRSVTLLIMLLLLIIACGKSPEKARKELGQMNIEYTDEQFLKHLKQGDKIVVELFLAAGMDPNKGITPKGTSGLIIAAEGGHTEIIKKLISKGGNVNKKNSEGVTALMVASSNGHTEVVKTLLNSGAEVNAKNTDGLSSLFYSAAKGYVDTAKVLIEKGADVITSAIKYLN